MIVESEKLSLAEPWRFAVVPLTAQDLKQRLVREAELLEIDGESVRCMRTFHEEVAADFFFASHYNCDPQAPLAALHAPVEGEQILIWWREARIMAMEAPDDWEAVLQMFRAAMATLYPQGRYLRMIFPTADRSLLAGAVRAAVETEAERAGVGFDYESGESHFDELVESKSRYRLPGG